MKTLKKIGKFLRRWNELISIPLALLLWIYFGPIIRMFDSTAGVFDSGLLMVIPYALIQFFFFMGVVWLYIKITFPNAYRMLDHIFEKHEQLTTWQKSVLVMWLFSLLVFAIVFLARVV